MVLGSFTRSMPHLVPLILVNREVTSSTGCQDSPRISSPYFWIQSGVSPTAPLEAYMSPSDTQVTTAYPILIGSISQLWRNVGINVYTSHLSEDELNSYGRTSGLNDLKRVL